MYFFKRVKNKVDSKPAHDKLYHPERRKIIFENLIKIGSSFLKLLELD